MSAGLYTGDIDWERIYRAFHAPGRVAVRIRRELPESAIPTIFSGFQETAARLANDLPLTFVDYASAITTRARARYPGLRSVLTGDVTRVVATLPDPNVVIACRISAYWDGPEYLQRLARSLQAFPRDCVLIDFFDLERVTPGRRFVFDAADGRGEWDVLELAPPAGKEPAFSRVKMRVSYAFDDHGFSYVGVRAFFHQQAIWRWSERNFPEYEVALGPPLLDRDPGFSLKLTRKRGR